MKTPKTFKEWLLEKDNLKEMAFISGTHDNSSFSLKNDWNSHFKKVSKTIISKLPKNYKIQEHMNYYFLTDKDDNYLGYIQLEDVTNKYKELNYKNIYQIKSSNSTGEAKGFYNIIFSSLLSRTKIECIISDNNLSSNALKSYTRLNKESKLNIQMLDQISKEIEDFNSKELQRNPSTVVMLSETYEMQEINKIYNDRIQNDYIYKNELLKESDSLYIMLYTKVDLI